MTSGTSNLIIGFLNDFLIVAGGIVSGAMLATKEVSLPSTAVIVLALVIGVTQAARRAQSKLDPSLATPVRTPEQRVEQIRANEAVITDAVTRALATAGVTPKRVDDVNPIKDSS